MTNANNIDFSKNHMTGGMPAEACYAPMKEGHFRRRLAALQRAKDAKRALYRHCATTGGGPPEECLAPLRPSNLAVRRRNEEESVILARRAAVGICLGVPPLRLSPLLPRGGARHGAHGGPRETQPVPPAPPVCLSAVSVPGPMPAPDPRYMTPPRR